MPAYNHFASILAILFSLAVFMTLFAIRYTLRERRWAAEVQTVRGVSSVYWIAGFFLLGLGAAMVVFIIYMLAIPQVSNPIANLSLMMLFAAAYSLASAGFAAGITLFVLEYDLRRLDQVVPQPIFMNTDRLLDVILSAVATTLSKKSSGQGKKSALEVVRLSRDESSGDVNLLILEHLGPRKSDNSHTWRVEADKWGRLKSMYPAFPPPQFSRRVIGGEG